MQFDTRKKLQEFIDSAKELSAFDKIDKIHNKSKEGTKRNVVLGKKIFSVAKELINNVPDEFIKLLDYEDLSVAEVAAECLYPVYPKKCIKILKEYSNTLSEDLEKYRVNTLIESFEKGQEFCINNFKKLFDCDDLSALNRE